MKSFPFCMSILFIALLLLGISEPSRAEDGYDLWLRYRPIQNEHYLKSCQSSITHIVVAGDSAMMHVVRDELHRGLNGLFNIDVPICDALQGPGALVVGTFEALQSQKVFPPRTHQNTLGREGFLIQSLNTPASFAINIQKPHTDQPHVSTVTNDGFSSDAFKGIIITADEEPGVLYGVFHLLRLIQTHQPLSDLNITERPKIQRRMLNHWDNLNRSIERGYAGKSIWQWEDLPAKLDPRYRDYARANASIGINGVVINNVNADPRILSDEYIEKWAALADIFRPYNIKVYISANFAAPMKGKGIGPLDTADPLNRHVQNWWKHRIEAIYACVPGFGGFLVKADSEGQPGPRQFGRDFNDGANMLAQLLAPHGGVVIWRSFNKDADNEPDPAKRNFQAYAPLDGKFAENVFVQPKNGPIDFQPLEPFHPLFGQMPQTPLMLEVQITQEYLGYSTHHVFLAPMWKNTLNSDTFACDSGSTVARVIDGSLDGHTLSGIAGVANIGSDRNWCGYHFGQANWYAFGRLAWNHELSSGQIADEWLRMTFTNDTEFVSVCTNMMLGSWQANVNYQTPLGLNVVCDSKHYNPDPKRRNGTYWSADDQTIGYDRTTSGSNAVSQYHQPVSNLFNDIHSCPEDLLLWFHRVSWDFTFTNGNSLWDEMVQRYDNGVEYVEIMNKQWITLSDKIDAERFNQITKTRASHLENAKKWRDTCVTYFSEINGRPIKKTCRKTSAVTQ